MKNAKIFVQIWTRLVDIPELVRQSTSHFPLLLLTPKMSTPPALPSPLPICASSHHICAFVLLSLTVSSSPVPPHALSWLEEGKGKRDEKQSVSVSVSEWVSEWVSKKDSKKESKRESKSERARERAREKREREREQESESESESEREREREREREY